MNKRTQIVNAHCNTCSGERTHEVVFTHTVHWREPLSDDTIDDLTGTDKYELLKCAGCNHIVFRHTSTHSQDYDDTGKLIETVTYSPPKQLRKRPRLFSTVAGSFQGIIAGPIPELFEEIYIALNSKCPRLASMGIRSLIEHVIIDKVGDQGSFTKNLDAFKQKGLISDAEKIIIETALEVGHASIHRSHKPSLDVLLSCLDISEALVNRLYLWQSQAKAISKTIPRRQQHDKTPSQK